MVEEIIERLSHGEPLARICRDAHLPSFRTVLRWEEEDEAFRHLSARARSYGTDYIADDCMDIADNPEIEPADKRIRIDTRLRLIGKWNARKYGEKQLLGSDPENPLPTPAVLDASKLSTEALREVLAAKGEGNG
ncbi:hypothetical protein [Novosphingobium aromaticivorans]|uniref:terminase small subunit-like protein n=1 Tax=Novosphingobium aromaticivorans TaxID=48935 RepID=UPI0012ECDB7F|nr:hypothetical protein [Novosphingobium aromaticivorans]